MKIRILFLFISLNSSLFAQNKFENLSNYFDSIEHYNLFSGSVALRKNDQIIFDRQFGQIGESMSNVQSGTKFRIGSISKTFTATLIMLAVEDKKLKTTDKVSKFFPSLPNSKKITIEHLLRHTAGIYNFTNDSLFWTRNEKNILQDELISIISNYPSQFQPGTKYEYSNSGYYLLACILEKVYQKKYENILNEKITIPLQLNNTYEGTTIEAAQNEALAITYSFPQQKWINQPITNSSHLLGAGGILSTPSELTHFMTALFTGEILTDKSLKQMKTFQFNYGYGILPIPYKLNSAYGHTGGIDTYSAITGFFDSDTLAFAITLNGYVNGMNDIAVAMLSAYFGDLIKMPTPISFCNVPVEKLDKYVGEYYNAQHKLKLLVEKDIEQNSLKIKLENQPSITTIPTQINIFEYPMVDAKFTFNSDKKTVVLNQFGNRLEFKLK